MNTSIIIPTYNEEKVIGECLESLLKQTQKCELIVVDDGSTDMTIEVIKKYSNRVILLTQSHKGPGAARNLGAQKAKGDILVLIDADMTLASDFVEILIAPIIKGKARGTFARNEFVSNWDNVWARCWNYNNGLYSNRTIAEDYPDTAPVFRAILKTEFTKSSGFDEGLGWTDDWSLSRRLGYQAIATKATCFHKNPDSLREVYFQARWIGKNEFFTKDYIRLVWNLFRHSLFISLFFSIKTAIKTKTSAFIVFSVVYDTAVSISLFETFLKIGHKHK